MIVDDTQPDESLPLPDATPIQDVEALDYETEQADVLEVAQQESPEIQEEHPVEDIMVPEEQQDAQLTPEEDEADTTTAAEIQRQQEAQIETAVASILDDPATDWDTLLTQSSVQELVVLIEALAKRDIERDSIRWAALTKKQFDSLYAVSLTEVNTNIDKHTTLDEKDELEAAKLIKSSLVTYSQRFGKALLAFNKRRHAWEEQQAAEREANAKVKRGILEELRQIVHTEQVQNISKVRELQKVWRDTGPVPHTEFEDINESYRALLDQFYNLRSKFNELLEQDRRYNLEEKERLIQEMEALAEVAQDEHDPKVWQELADRVTAMHETWKHIGPIPREETETTWQRFKSATDRFYELRRAFFETRDEQRTENTALKQALLAELQPFASYTASSQEAWNQASEAVQALQERWRLIGPASRDVGKQLFRTYREVLNSFYKNRAAFYETLNEARKGLLDQKKAILQQAVELAALGQTDTSIQDLSERFKALQREWKKTGLDDYRDARKLAKKFRAICDAFFKSLKERYANQHAAEEENLNSKEALIAKLEGLAATESLPEGVTLEEELKAIQAAWDEIGHVPFKLKDKVYARYRKALNHFLQQQEDDPEKRETLMRSAKYLSMGSKEGGNQVLDRERRKIQAQIRTAEETITQYENNILFISKGKAGDTLRAEIQKKIEQAHRQIEQLRQELKAMKSAKDS